MIRYDKVASLMNDLVRINRDRMAGYEKALTELKEADADLVVLFQRYIAESSQYLAELNREVTRLGGEPADGTTASGKVYRIWMDLKAAVSGGDRKTVLSNCEFGEDAAQKAYDAALSTDLELEAPQRELLVRQKAQLRMAHDEVKSLRDVENNR